jgi:hypothetical protein
MCVLVRCVCWCGVCVGVVGGVCVCVGVIGEVCVLVLTGSNRYQLRCETKTKRRRRGFFLHHDNVHRQDARDHTQRHERRSRYGKQDLWCGVVWCGVMKI